MGTDDLGRRALLQGLIKVAAAYVHDVRGNPAGIARNLTGARALPRRGRATNGPADNVAGRRRPALSPPSTPASPTWRPTPTGRPLVPPDLPKERP